jgi:hypothetical protein
MPWEIDYALLTFTQLKKSKYYLSSNVNITINTVLNLSSYLINWEESKLPKEYFIEKYNTLSLLLEDYTHNSRIYDGNEMYGFFDLQRDSISKETDYYIHICPDIYFSEYTLYYLIESISQIKNKYFVISPQHRKLTDSSWDPTTDKTYLDIPYNNCDEISIFDIRYNNKNNNEVYIEQVNSPKFAGWFDLYSKDFYEELCPIHDDWSGYGPWDFYSLILINSLSLNTTEQNKIDFQQYVLRSQTIGDYWIGNWKHKNGLSGYYKDLIVKNKNSETSSQRQIFEANMGNYVKKGLQMLKEKNII